MNRNDSPDGNRHDLTDSAVEYSAHPVNHELTDDPEVDAHWS